MSSTLLEEPTLVTMLLWPASISLPSAGLVLEMPLP